jgi:predicted aspartyl protease
VLAHGAHGQDAEVEAVIDTGCTGFLTLPARLIAMLGLSFAGTTWVTLQFSSRLDLGRKAET